MRKHKHEDDNYIEYSLFKNFTHFSWGIDTKLNAPQQEGNSDDVLSKVMLYVPLYDITGGNNTSKNNKMKKEIIGDPNEDPVEVKLNKFWIRYFKFNEKADSNEDDGPKNSSDGHLVNLKVSWTLKSDNFGVGSQDSEYVLQFQIESIKKIVRHKQNDGSTDLYITVSYMPDCLLFTKEDTFGGRKRTTYKKIPNLLNSERAIDNCVISQLIFKVSGTFDTSIEQKFLLEMEPVMNENNTRYHKLSLEFEQKAQKNCLEYINKLHNHLWSLPFIVHYSFLWLFSTKIIRLLEYSQEYILDFIDLVKVKWEEEPTKIKWIDKCLAKIRHKRYYDECKAKVEDLKKNIQESDSSSNLLERIQDLEIQSDLVKSFLENFKEMNIAEATSYNKREMIPVPRVVITPTLVEYKFKTVNMPNRVIRTFKDNSDNFIRVTFQNEDHSSGKYNHSSNKPLLEQIKCYMENGITIGEGDKAKTFVFLHYSNSQMKAHSCWFISETENLTYDEIMKSLGNFENETKVSKNAARKGQAFSSAIKVATLNSSEDFELIDDIKSENGKYTFSDGCGYIDYDFAQKIAKENYEVMFWHAYQIRMGGFKGVLAAKKDLEKETGKKVQVRKSMKKFDIDTDAYPTLDLEVIRMATYSTGYLNKQVIGILWANGVDPNIFLEMQKRYVDDIKLHYNSENLKQKSQEYPSRLLSAIKFLDSKLKRVYKDVDIYQDPLIGPLIKLVCFNRFNELRTRFRVYDPDCWVLMGIIDPYGVLEEGEVFVQYSKVMPKAKGKGQELKKTVLEGKMLVSRNPCVHPGDIRVLNAVDRFQLKDLVNVIVFPSKGSRPEQDKMASGDLDGDIYWISWRKEFVESFTESTPNGEEESKVQIIDKPISRAIEKRIYVSDSEEDDAYVEGEDGPMLVSDQTVEKESKSPVILINRQSCIKNFIDFIKNDMLGEVANLHSKIADSDREAIYDNTALELAEMHSKAVDYQKHGELLNIERFEKIKLENNYNVDFMSRGKKNIKINKIVESPGVLGQMFRQLKDDLNQDDLLKFEYECKILCSYSPKLYATEDITVWDYLLNAYTEIVKPYNIEIKQIMYEKELTTESDIFNQHCAFSNLVNTRDEMFGHQNDIELLINDLEEKFKAKIKSIKAKIKPIKYRKKFDEAIKFATYFDLSHLDKPELKEYLDVDEFNEFVDYLKDEKFKESQSYMSEPRFKEIVYKGFTEDNDIRDVIDKVRIFSAWWLLTD